MTKAKQDEATKQKEDNGKAGSLAGVGAGALAGAQVGTVLLPIPVAGTFTGALVGGVLGSRVGKNTAAHCSINSTQKNQTAQKRPLKIKKM